MNIKLKRAIEAFYVLALSDDIKLRMKILDRNLFISQLELKPPLLHAHADVLATKRKSYPVTHTQIKIFTASCGPQQVFIDNAFLRSIPEDILTAPIKNTAFVVSASTNPFHFSRFDTTNFMWYYTVFSTLPNHTQYNALHLSELTGFTRNSFRV